MESVISSKDAQRLIESGIAEMVVPEFPGDQLGLRFITKDSGAKAVYEDGMQRDTSEGKPKFGLMFPKGVAYEDQLITRVAALYERGGAKYGDRNWEKSSTEESLAHHEEAFWRHAVKFFLGVDDGEDHAAAIVWNINAVELSRRNVLKTQLAEVEEAKTEVRRELAFAAERREEETVPRTLISKPVALRDNMGDLWEPHDDGTWSCWITDSRGIWDSPHEPKNRDDDFWHAPLDRVRQYYSPLTEIFAGTTTADNLPWNDPREHPWD